MERKNVWNTFSAKQLEEVDAFGKEYMYFLDHGKTERECTDLVVNMIEKEGYVELSQHCFFVLVRQLLNGVADHDGQRGLLPLQLLDLCVQIGHSDHDLLHHVSAGVSHAVLVEPCATRAQTGDKFVAEGLLPSDDDLLPPDLHQKIIGCI